MKEAEMQKWEYLVLTIANCRDYDGGNVKYINGRQLENWRKENWRLPAALQHYGEEGWELVSQMWRVSGGGTTYDPLYIFKRPKA
jgi:hypothetical protein